MQKENDLPSPELTFPARNCAQLLKFLGASEEVLDMQIWARTVPVQA
jgi:hypothetical protein